jgi:hypothetical protein
MKLTTLKPFLNFKESLKKKLINNDIWLLKKNVYFSDQVKFCVNVGGSWKQALGVALVWLLTLAFELMFALVLTLALGLGLAFADRDNQGLGIINFRDRNNESLDFVKRTLRLGLG